MNAKLNVMTRKDYRLLADVVVDMYAQGLEDDNHVKRAIDVELAIGNALNSAYANFDKPKWHLYIQKHAGLTCKK